MTRVVRLVYETGRARSRTSITSLRARQQRRARGQSPHTRDASSPRHLPDDLRQPGRLRDHHPAAAVLRRRRSARRRSSIGLLFAVFSLCQLVAAPVLGDLSDRYGRRPVLIFSLLGTVVELRDAGAGARHRDAVRRAHRRRPVGRQHLDGPRLRRRRDRSRRIARGRTA